MRSHLTISLLAGGTPQPLELDSETSISLQWQSPFFHAQHTFTYDFTVPASPANLAATLRAAGTPTLHEGLPPLPARLETPLGSWDGELTVTDASPLRITLSFVYLEPWVRAAQAVPLSAVNFSTGPGHPGCRYLKDETVAYLQCQPDDTRTNPVYYAVGLVHAVRRILAHLGLPYDSAFWDAQQHLETLYLVPWAPNAHGCRVYDGAPGTDIRLPSPKSCYEILLGVAAVLNAVWVWHQGRLILYCPGQGYYTRAAVRPYGRASFWKVGATLQGADVPRDGKATPLTELPANAAPGHSLYIDGDKMKHPYKVTCYYTDYHNGNPYFDVLHYSTPKNPAFVGAGFRWNLSLLPPYPPRDGGRVYDPELQGSVVNPGAFVSALECKLYELKSVFEKIDTYRFGLDYYRVQSNSWHLLGSLPTARGQCKFEGNVIEPSGNQSGTSITEGVAHPFHTPATEPHDPHAAFTSANLAFRRSVSVLLFFTTTAKEKPDPLEPDSTPEIILAHSLTPIVPRPPQKDYPVEVQSGQFVLFYTSRAYPRARLALGELGKDPKPEWLGLLHILDIKPEWLANTRRAEFGYPLPSDYLPPSIAPAVAPAHPLAPWRAATPLWVADLPEFDELRALADLYLLPADPQWLYSLAATLTPTTLTITALQVCQPRFF